MDNSRFLPPVPRIPSAANPTRLPDPAHLEPFHPPAAKTVAEMIAVFERAWQAITDLEESRPDGRLFREAEDEAVKLNSPGRLAGLIEREPMRYATAVVLARRAVVDQDDIRRAAKRTLNTAADKITAHVTELVERFTTAAETAWEDRNTTPALVALDEAERLHADIQRLTAIAAWCEGVDQHYAGQRANPATPAALGAFVAARAERTGQQLLAMPPGTVPPRGWESSKKAFAAGSIG